MAVRRTRVEAKPPGERADSPPCRRPPTSRSRLDWPEARKCEANVGPHSGPVASDGVEELLARQSSVAARQVPVAHPPMLARQFAFQERPESRIRRYRLVGNPD